VAGRDELDHLAHDLLGRLHRLGLAVERDDVAAQEHVGGEIVLERLQDGIPRAGELLGDLVVELDLSPHPARASLTCCETRRPSARPATAFMAIGMTLPMSLADSAPLSATAAAAICASSSSDSSAGR
jgi:hypothetical protein